MTNADARSRAERCIATARTECAEIGLTPREFGELLLPEALLAFMVEGMKQQEVAAVFNDFAGAEIPNFFLRIKKVTGYCDCHRESLLSHDPDCEEGLVRNSLFTGPRLLVNDAKAEVDSIRAQLSETFQNHRSA